MGLDSHIITSFIKKLAFNLIAGKNLGRDMPHFPPILKPVFNCGRLYPRTRPPKVGRFQSTARPPAVPAVFTYARRFCRRWFLWFPFGYLSPCGCVPVMGTEVIGTSPTTSGSVNSCGCSLYIVLMC